MKNFINYIYIPIIIFITALLSLPVTSDYIKLNYPTTTTIAAIVIVISSVLNYYFNQLKLFNEQEDRLKKAMTARPIYRELNKFRATFNAHSISIHILIPVKKYWFKIEPDESDPTKLSFSWSGYIFKPEWQLGTHIHNELKLTTNQGYAGAVFEAGPNTGVKFGVLNNPNLALPNFNFSQKQRQLLDGLVFVACCSIPDINNDGMSKGVLSVDSTVPGSEVLLTDQDLLKDFVNAMEELAIVISDILK